MTNRWIGIFLLALMLLANTAVMVRDVLPAWFAGDAPPPDALFVEYGRPRLTQVAIYDSQGRPLGRSWTRSQRGGEIVTTSQTTLLEPLTLPTGHTTPRIRIETELTFLLPGYGTGGIATQPFGESRAPAAAGPGDKDAPRPANRDPRLDSLDFRVIGLGFPVELRGSVLPSDDFPCTWRAGPHTGQFSLDSFVPRAVGDVIRPFDRLHDLYVGRTWRVKLLDPLAVLFHDDASAAPELDSELVRVVGVERLALVTGSVEAFVVQSANATAWVAADGTVLRTEVVVPLLGRLVLLDEPYDEAAWREARARVGDDGSTDAGE